MIRNIKQCERCLRFKAVPNKTPMENVGVTYPMELVYMDCLMNEANEGGKEVHILVITDHFTWYAQTIVTSSQTTKCTAQNLCPLWASRDTIPRPMDSANTLMLP